MWRETTKHERNRMIWEQELAGFIPDRVFDAHVHIWDRASVPDDKGFDCGGHNVVEYPFEAFDQDLAEVFPGRQTGGLCFGIPFPQYNTAANNQYIGQAADRERFFGLRLIDPRENPDEVRHAVEEHGFLGFKPYPDFARPDDVANAEIHEMLPESIMAIADEMGLVVMLHIPRKLRLADPLNQTQLVELCTAWPRAKIILAHVGRSYYLAGIEGQLERIKDLDNLYYDVAMVMNADVLTYAFTNLPAERVLFGSDIPIALAAGHSVEINNQYTYVTPKPWPLSISDDHGKLVFTSFLYEELRAIKRAVLRAKLSDAFIEGLFSGHARRLLDTVR